MQIDVSFAEEELGTGASKCKILGVSWNKNNKNDVNLNISSQVYVNRGMLKFLASFFGPLGLISLVMLMEKNVYRLGYYQKLTLDQKISEIFFKEWNKWVQSLPLKVEFPRGVCLHQGKTYSAELHVFADKSLKGVSPSV